jgi:hypothetical protein
MMNCRIAKTKKAWMIRLALLAAVGLPVATYAYIPSTHTIASRLAKNDGHGVYIIEQEAVFRTAGEPLVLKERWLVENSELMRVTVSSIGGAKSPNEQPVHFEAIYKDGRRTADDLEGGVKSAANSPEMIEGFLHTRSEKGFLSTLVHANIVPATIFHDRPKFTNLNQVKYPPEPFVRLGRSSGVIAWIFGEPTPTEATTTNPEAWVEQDAFILRRLRFPSEAEVEADHHSTYAGALKLPRERTVSWGTNSVFIRVLSVKPATAAQVASQMNPNSLGAGAKTAHLPDQAQVREFYQRFR